MYTVNRKRIDQNRIFYSKEKEEQRTKDRKEGYLTARIFNC